MGTQTFAYEQGVSGSSTHPGQPQGRGGKGQAGLSAVYPHCGARAEMPGG